MEINHPHVLISNVAVNSRSYIEYPILTKLKKDKEYAIVAIVKGTDEKIEFWIDVIHALKINLEDLIFKKNWIEDFKRGSKDKRIFDVRDGKKGWTKQIITAALKPYQSKFKRQPECMVGVFDQFNHRIFWETFSRLYPKNDISDFDPNERANIAAECIRTTPFFNPRKELGYSTIMVEVDALLKKDVLVRTFRDNLPVEDMYEIGEAYKTHGYLHQFDNWILAENI